jgi:hypothetical protein
MLGILRIRIPFMNKLWLISGYYFFINFTYGALRIIDKQKWEVMTNCCVG